MPHHEPLPQATTDEHGAYHALASLLHADYVALARLRSLHGTWTNALSAGSERTHRASAAATPLQALGETGIELLLREDAAFPSQLREIPHPPHAIYVRGARPTSNQRLVAVVGTRKATASGKECAERFSRELAHAGCAVVSGLALGIDAAAHGGALEAKGYTVAVLATGLDRVYPQLNAKLAARILENGGALISEYPPGSPTLPYRFLERNRIVSGLSEGVLVIEAPSRSGSLATARFALEQNRQVFVLPGPATHQNFAGSHDLIRAGAELVTEPAHILESLGMSESAQKDPAHEAASDEERLVLSLLAAAGGPLDIDAIIEHTNLNAQTASQIITFLVIRGAVLEDGAGYRIR